MGSKSNGNWLGWLDSDITHWFDRSTPPVNIGVYEVKSVYPNDEGPYFSFWDGEGWSGWFDEPTYEAMMGASKRGNSHTQVWRGLTV